MSLGPRKRVLIMEDLSAVGTLSMGVALPILAAFNHQCLPLPSQLLATQSEGFGAPVRQRLADWLPAVFTHWATTITPDAALIGYLGDPQVAQVLTTYLQRHPLTLCVLDPAFADDGQLYPGLDASLVTATAALMPAATIITPNVTEAAWLLHKDPQAHHRPEDLLQQLQQAFPQAHVVLTGIVQGSQIGCLWVDHQTPTFIGTAQLPGHFYGAGDVFAACLTGCLLTGIPLKHALTQALTLTQQALVQTVDQVSHRPDGIALSAVLATIATQSYRFKEESAWQQKPLKRN